MCDYLENYEDDEYEGEDYFAEDFGWDDEEDFEDLDTSLASALVSALGLEITPEGEVWVTPAQAVILGELGLVDVEHPTAFRFGDGPVTEL